MTKIPGGIWPGSSSTSPAWHTRGGIPAVARSTCWAVRTGNVSAEPKTVSGASTGEFICLLETGDEAAASDRGYSDARSVGQFLLQMIRVHLAVGQAQTPETI